MAGKLYRQRPIRGGRNSLPSCVLGRIYDRVDAEARRYHVSRSFVIATVLAEVFDVDDQEDYRRVTDRPMRKRKRER